MGKSFMIGKVVIVVVLVLIVSTISIDVYAATLTVRSGGVMVAQLLLGAVYTGFVVGAVKIALKRNKKQIHYSQEQWSYALKPCLIKPLSGHKPKR